MKWKELSLSEPALVPFPDGVMALASYHPEKALPSVGGTGEAQGWGQVIFPDGRELTLSGLVDDGETTEAPTTIVLYGTNAHEILFLGGSAAYTISSSGIIKGKWALARESSLAEHWRTQIVDTAVGTLIIFEGEVLLVGSGLELIWRQRKLINDFFEAVQNNRAWFLRDHTERWSISLADGDAAAGPRLDDSA